MLLVDPLPRTALELPGSKADPVTKPLAEAYNALVDRYDRRVHAFDGPFGLFYGTLQGLLVMSGQTYGAAITLVKDEAGDKIYPVQAEMLARSNLEGLGVVMALRESPEKRARQYALDMMRHLRRNCAEMTFSFANKRWLEWAEEESKGIRSSGDTLKVSRAEWEKLASWPSAGQLTRPETKGGVPYLTGSAAEVWELLYFIWYGDLSTAVHQKGKGLLMAMRRHRTRGEERRALRNDAVIAATIAHACSLTELCACRPWLRLPVQPLREAWSHLRAWADVAERVYDVRFRGVLDSI